MMAMLALAAAAWLAGLPIGFVAWLAVGSIAVPAIHRAVVKDDR